MKNVEIELTKIGSKKRREEYRRDFIGHGWRGEASSYGCCNKEKKINGDLNPREKGLKRDQYAPTITYYLFIYFTNFIYYCMG